MSRYKIKRSFEEEEEFQRQCRKRKADIHNRHIAKYSLITSCLSHATSSKIKNLKEPRSAERRRCYWRM